MRLSNLRWKGYLLHSQALLITVLLCLHMDYFKYRCVVICTRRGPELIAL